MESKSTPRPTNKSTEQLYSKNKIKGESEMKTMIRSEQKTTRSDPQFTERMTKNATIDPKSDPFQVSCYPKSEKQNIQSGSGLRVTET